jgi:hypothetical protein
MLWGDTVGLAAFAAIGAHTAAALGFHPLVVAVSGDYQTYQTKSNQIKCYYARKTN